MVKQGYKLSSQEKTLLRPPSKSEADRVAYIRSWLEHDVKVPSNAIRSEYTTDEGPIDLYLTNRRIIIEVKKDDKLKNGPDESGIGSRPSETAFEQLTRYTRAERERENFTHSEVEDDVYWLGVVTDGIKWWIWRWDSYTKNKYSRFEKIPEWHGATLDNDNIRNLADLFKRKVGKDWATTDMTNVFDVAKINLLKLYKQCKSYDSTQTQQGLWLEQLKGGGNEPLTDIDDVFVMHTMLILISRLVSNSKAVLDGFVRWVEPKAVDDIKKIIANWDWRQETGDILRALYEHYISPDHRKIFGEYYTPDWLAEAICKTVIDDEFIKQQIRHFNANEKLNGVLDPSCGSGVFLYFTVKHIMNCDQLNSFDETQKMNFICKLIHGIDIHPVAVEMARANIRRIFPNVSESEIRIYQGDSLMIPRAEFTFLTSEGDLILESPKGQELKLPKWFIVNELDISQFVGSACNKSDMPPGLSESLEGYNFEELKKAHDQLRKIVDNEGNGVWKWYILNQVGPMKLKDSIGRLVTNPPWVSFDKLQIEKRKTDIKNLAVKRELWIGGKHTRFDIANLFVDRCISLYLTKDAKSGWVLPYTAMKDGGSYKKLHVKIGNKITAKWDMGTLPFPTKSCVLFLNTKTQSQEVVKIKGKKLRKNDSYDIMKEKTIWTEPFKTFPTVPSEWRKRKRRALTRQGATIRPHCLSWIGSTEPSNDVNMIIVTTKKSTQRGWKDLGVFRGEIPKKWIYKTLSPNNLIPYTINGYSDCILPIKNNIWDLDILGYDFWSSDRLEHDFWKKLQVQYKKNCGIGSHTPKTLEDCLDYNHKLFSQFKRSGSYIMYNNSGKILTAAKVPDNIILQDTLSYLSCTSDDEVYFLLGILNSKAMLPAFVQTQKTDRHFHSYFWHEIPIPRFDKYIEHHPDMVKYVKHAEKIAIQTCNTYEKTYDNLHDRKNKKRSLSKIIHGALQKDGVSAKIDDLCKQLFPRHTI